MVPACTSALLLPLYWSDTITLNHSQLNHHQCAAHGGNQQDTHTETHTHIHTHNINHLRRRSVSLLLTGCICRFSGTAERRAEGGRNNKPEEPESDRRDAGSGCTRCPSPLSVHHLPHRARASLKGSVGSWRRRSSKACNSRPPVLATSRTVLCDFVKGASSLTALHMRAQGKSQGRVYFSCWSQGGCTRTEVRP